jgi:hypothetical protein
MLLPVQSNCRWEKSELKKEFTAQVQKLEFPPAEENFVLTAPSRFQLVPQVDTFAESQVQKPLAPPPMRVIPHTKGIHAVAA